MAKKNFGNIADDFLQQTDNRTESATITNNNENKTKTIAYGRPKAKDIDGEEIKKLGVYITSRQFKMLNEYSFKNEMDKSEAIRHILKEFFKNHTSPLTDERSE